MHYFQWIVKQIDAIGEIVALTSDGRMTTWIDPAKLKLARSTLSIDSGTCQAQQISNFIYHRDFDLAVDFSDYCVVGQTQVILAEFLELHEFVYHPFPRFGFAHLSTKPTQISNHSSKNPRLVDADRTERVNSAIQYHKPQ